MTKKKENERSRKEAEKEELRERLRKQRLTSKKLREAVDASNRAAKQARFYKPKKMIVVEEHGRAFMMEESKAREYFAQKCEGCAMLTKDKELLAKENEELKKRLNRSLWSRFLIFLGLKKDE